MSGEAANSAASELTPVETSTGSYLGVLGDPANKYREVIFWSEGLTPLAGNARRDDYAVMRADSRSRNGRALRVMQMDFDQGSVLSWQSGSLDRRRG